MRSVVDGIELGFAFNLPVFPSFSALGKGEAGSYRTTGPEAGKAEFVVHAWLVWLSQPSQNANSRTIFALE
jgi:hypothetical protein